MPSHAITSGKVGTSLAKARWSASGSTISTRRPRSRWGNQSEVMTVPQSQKAIVDGPSASDPANQNDRWTQPLAPHAHRPVGPPLAQRTTQMKPQDLISSSPAPRTSVRWVPPPPPGPPPSHCPPHWWENRWEPAASSEQPRDQDPGGNPPRGGQRLRARSQLLMAPSASGPASQDDYWTRPFPPYAQHPVGPPLAHGGIQMRSQYPTGSPPHTPNRCPRLR